MTVAEALDDLVARLDAAGVPTPRVDAELLVAHVLRRPRSGLGAARTTALSREALDELQALAARRVQREPLQLLVGSVGFRYLDIDVRPGVFIPRPETEVLAGMAIERVDTGAVVVEPCTGTGAVACAVATETDAAMVVATDASAAAVRLAQHNARRCDAPVTVLYGDLLTPVPADLRGEVSVIVCNPPYVAAGEMANVAPEVRWDPVQALVAGPTGNEVVELLVLESPAWLRPGGWLMVEIDPARADVTAQRFHAAGFTDVAVERDLAGRDRIVLGTLPRR